MISLRNFVDWGYGRSKEEIFEKTKKDPEGSHGGFIWLARGIHRLRLEKLLLDCPENYLYPEFEISTAAGFNKNGVIPPTFLEYLGFDRVVVGTVTADSWEGNLERPRIWRFPETNSMVNYLGLPGEGAEIVAENLSKYGKHGVSLTVSLMSTPEKTEEAALKDIRKTVRIMRDVYGVDRFQFNGSCPNTPEAEDMLGAYLQDIREEAYPYQTIEVKVSPDIDEKEAEKIVTIGTKEGVKGIVTTNTTKDHDPTYIPKSPGKGGASGHAVYDSSFKARERTSSP